MNPIENNNEINNLLNNPLIYAVLGLFLAFYSPRLQPKLPPLIRELFNNNFFRLLILTIIAFISSKDLTLSILVSLAFLIVISFSSNQDAKDEILSENPEGFSDLKLVKEFYTDDRNNEGPETFDNLNDEEPETFSNPEEEDPKTLVNPEEDPETFVNPEAEVSAEEVINSKSSCKLNSYNLIVGNTSTDGSPVPYVQSTENFCTINSKDKNRLNNLSNASINESSNNTSCNKSYNQLPYAEQVINARLEAANDLNKNVCN